MNFIAMIIALGLLQVWGSGGRVQHDEWHAGLHSALQGKGLSSTSGFMLSIGLPVIAVSVVLSVFESVFFGFFTTAFTVIVLLYSFGRGDFQALQARYRSYCDSEDFEGAFLSAQSDFSSDLDVQTPNSPQEFQLQIQRCLLYEGYQRWFAVLFYFVVLGPEGALAYRLLQLCTVTQGDGAPRRLLFIVDWVPVRLLAAMFTLTGDFVRSRGEFLASLFSSSKNASVILLLTARAALALEYEGGRDDQQSFGRIASAQLAEFEALLSRSATSWLVLISVLVLLF